MDFRAAQKTIEVLASYIKKVDIDNYNKIKDDLNFYNDEKDDIEFKYLENRISTLDRIFIDNKARYIRNSS